MRYFFQKLVNWCNRIFINEKGQLRLYGDRGGKTIWECIFDEKDYEGKEANFPWVMPQFQMLDGCIPIIGKGTAATPKVIVRQYVLILNGKYRGEVWWISKQTIRRITGTGLPVNALTIMDYITYGGQ